MEKILLKKLVMKEFQTTVLYIIQNMIEYFRTDERMYQTVSYLQTAHFLFQSVVYDTRPQVNKSGS